MWSCSRGTVPAMMEILLLHTISLSSQGCGSGEWSRWSPWRPCLSRWMTQFLQLVLYEMYGNKWGEFVCWRQGFRFWSLKEMENHIKRRTQRNTKNYTLVQQAVASADFIILIWIYCRSLASKIVKKNAVVSKVKSLPQKSIHSLWKAEDSRENPNEIHLKTRIYIMILILC